ncbi:hypothetical protein GQX74_009037, partial [Glossina fuscipes]
IKLIKIIKQTSASSATPKQQTTELRSFKGKAHRLTNYGSALAWQNLAEWNENNLILINSQLKTLFNLTPIIKDAGPYFKSLQQKEFMPQQSVFKYEFGRISIASYKRQL